MRGRCRAPRHSRAASAFARVQPQRGTRRAGLGCFSFFFLASVTKVDAFFDNLKLSLQVRSFVLDDYL